MEGFIVWLLLLTTNSVSSKELIDSRYTCLVEAKKQKEEDSVQNFLKLMDTITSIGVDSGIPQIALIAAPLRMNKVAELTEDLRDGFRNLRDIISKAESEILCANEQVQFAKIRARASTAFEMQQLYYDNFANFRNITALLDVWCTCHKNQNTILSNLRTYTDAGYGKTCLDEANHRYTAVLYTYRQMRFVSWALATFEITCTDSADLNDRLPSIKEHLTTVWAASHQLYRYQQENVLKKGLVKASLQVIRDSERYAETASFAGVPDALVLAHDTFDNLLEQYNNENETFGASFFTNKEKCGKAIQYILRNNSFMGQFSQTEHGNSNNVSFFLHRQPNVRKNQTSRIDNRFLRKLNRDMTESVNLRDFDEKKYAHRLFDLHPFPLISVVAQLIDKKDDPQCVFTTESGLKHYTFYANKRYMHFKITEWLVHVTIGL
ncbi:hypothetical protein L596_023622 [Steinernema carpocapsae]|uniref:Prolyl 4-hydroxylase alpha-subunit N-terminal domain-containing protein n=1 Tax=Steinernema carpocapsae TaxID=34508 RepID=A0A4U5MEZ2_STECR|nr:hypothetical protein L596_023622 [Steinernema carpocapsae]